MCTECATLPDDAASAAVCTAFCSSMQADNAPDAAVCTALAAVCKLIGLDLINAVLRPVTSLASHPKDLVRKRTMCACAESAPLLLQCARR